MAKAEEKEVVLLLDEADALFGKRNGIEDANDRHAISETNYLLQRLETYTGVVILTSNSREKMDKAFVRRMDLVIDFTQPRSKQWFNKKK